VLIATIIAALTCGTQQLLNSIMYYVLGYVAWQDGAVWPALALAVIMTGMFGTLTAVDINLSEAQRVQAVILIILGPLCSAVLIIEHVLSHGHINDQGHMCEHLTYLFPMVCLSHAAWLLWFLRAMEIEELHNGSFLPTQFRAVMYLDVFGWKDNLASKQAPQVGSNSGGGHEDAPSLTVSGRRATVDALSNTESLADDLESVKRELNADMNRWQAKKLRMGPSFCGNSCSQPDHVRDNEEHLLGFAGVFSDQDHDDLNQLRDGIGVENLKRPTPSSNNKHHVTHTCQEAPADIFDPSTYLPVGAQDSGEDQRRTSSKVHMNPGRWPARVFHSATLLLAFLWFLGVLYPTFRTWMDHPQIEQIFAEVEEEGKVEEQQGFMGTDPNGNPMFIPVKHHNFLSLTGGVKLRTSWPSHAGFFPRAISVDSLGEIIVSDDIGLFATKSAALLVNPSSEDGAGGTDLVPTLEFHMVSPCRGLEGQALRDVSVVCERGTARVDCKVFVLIASGPTIMECPLPYYQRDSSGHMLNNDGANANWSISNTWLYKEHDEEVASLAIDDDCVERTPGSQRLGCIVVGTSAKSKKDTQYGRIVQLKTHLGHEHELVPNRSIHVRKSWVNPGALHVTDTGYILALSTKQKLKDRRRTEATMEAFHSDTGKLKATWALPTEVDWLTISGGGKFLMILGLRQKPWGFELWRFPLPAKLL